MNSLHAKTSGRMSGTVRAAVLLALACASTNAMAAGNTTYVLQLVDYPGADYTSIYGINDNGGITGNAAMPGQDETIPFVYDPVNGFKRLPVAKGYKYLFANGLNNSGTVATSQVDASKTALVKQSGATYAHGRYTLLSRPGSQFTSARAINDAGMVTGYGFDEVPCNDFPGCLATSGYAAYLYDSSSHAFTDIPNPFATYPDDSMIAQGINGSGKVVGNLWGTYKNVYGNYGWVRDPTSGTLHLFSVANSRYTNARGINDRGDIAGYISVDGGGQRSFVKTAGSATMLPVPVGMVATDQVAAEAINNGSQIGGVWQQSGLGPVLAHGFIATPAIVPDTAVQGNYGFSSDVVANDRVFLATPIAHGFRYISSTLPFTTVRLPIGVGDNRYTLHAGLKSYDVAAGELFDFRTHGFPAGVHDFRVNGIEIASVSSSGTQRTPKRSATRAADAATAIDLGPAPFATELTFGGTGTFVGQVFSGQDAP